MKRTKLTIASFAMAAIMVSCGGTEEASENKTEENTTTEEQVVEETDAKEEEVEEHDVLTNFDLTHGQAGAFTLNAAFPGEGKYQGYDIVKKEETFTQEDGPYTVTSYHAMHNGDTHVIIFPMEGNESIIAELHVISSVYTTQEGIGVGSSIDDFYNTFKDAKAYYTYISGAFWLESEVYGSLKFLINEDDHNGDVEFTSDLTERSKEDFKEGAEIQKIRIY